MPSYGKSPHQSVCAWCPPACSHILIVCRPCHTCHSAPPARSSEMSVCAQSSDKGSLPVLQCGLLVFPVQGTRRHMFRLLLSGRLRISKGRTDVMHCSEGRSRDVWRSPRTCPDCLLLPMADGKRFFYFVSLGMGIPGMRLSTAEKHWKASQTYVTL